MKLINLLQLEWKKLKHNDTIKVLLIFYLALLPSLFLVGKSIPFPDELGSSSTFYMFPKVWNYLGYVGNWLNWFFLGFFAILIITNEFSYKTLRQNIINGVSRQDFYISKIATLLFVSLAVSLYFFLVGGAFGLTHTETIYLTKATENLYIVPQFFLNAFSYMVFALFLAVILRRTGAALVAYVGYVMFLEPILRWWIHANAMRKSVNNTMHYYPMNATEDLLPLPVPSPDFATNNDMPNLEVFLSSTEAITVTLIFVSLFIAFSYYKIMRSDL